MRYTYRKDDDSSFPVQTQYRYTSQWFEDGLGASAEDELDRGLYYYGARWYDSYLNRWIQPDTIVPNPGDPQSLNRYTYVNNNPLRYTDPTGHYVFEDDPDDQYFIPPGRSPVDQAVRMESDPCLLGGCKTPTTAEFLSVVGAPFVLAGVAVAGEVILVDLAVPIAHTGWLKLLEALGVACASGGCGNEAQGVFGQLRRVGEDVWGSTAGLRYGIDPRYGNRVQHVLSHASDIPSRRIHGVFSVGRSQVLSLVDEAYTHAQQAGSNVTATVKGSRTIYTVDVGRPIGYVGGQIGSTLGYPTAQHIQLVIEGINDVITAFPIIP